MTSLFRSNRHLTKMTDFDSIAIHHFQAYLRIPSVHPNIDYGQCVEFITKYARELELQVRVLKIKPDKPVIIITWPGTQPDLPSVLLNSHMDVVSVSKDRWSHDPFGAEIVDGKIYGRGAQDMKCVGIQYLEAIRRLKTNGARFKRTIHLSFVPEEEIGGAEGMGAFVKTKAFEDLKVAVALDEGVASEDDTFKLFYGEKVLWQFTIKCKGQSGHASLFLSNLSSDKIAFILKKAKDYTMKSKEMLEQNPSLNIGHVTTINCTKLSGGIQNNVIPAEMSITLDSRIDSSKPLVEFEEMIESWCREAGDGCEIVYHQKDEFATDTKIDESNPFWTAFKRTTDALGMTVRPLICMGVSDMRYLRQLGIPAFGFSPMNNTKVTMHSEDEYLGVDTFLRGIDIYIELISNLANV